MNVVFDVYWFDARVDARGGETSSAARKRDVRDVLVVMVMKFVFVVDEGVWKV